MDETNNIDNQQDEDVKQHVRTFYDEVGWKQVSDGIYQNARYEDLRPVSRQYITNCHRRVKRHLAPSGKLLLDAGSGPIQYPAYLEYSETYDKRVCLDISITALVEARKRIEDKGLFVVADVAKLPFRADAFDGLVSLHTIHHLPIEDHIGAYQELHRVMAPGKSGVIVNGWHLPFITRMLDFPIKLLRFSRGRGWGRRKTAKDKRDERVGTYVEKYNAAWLKRELGKYMSVDIRVWRSVSVRDLRFYIRPKLGGAFWLKVLYRLEEWFPRWFGKYGQYPMVVIKKEGK